MQCELLATTDPAVTAAELRALIPGPESVAETVSEIIGTVRSGGDDAVLAYTRELDTSGAPPRPLVVEDRDLDAAAEQLDPTVRSGLEQAIDNVRRVAESALDSDEQRKVDFGTHSVTLRTAPVSSAAVYVPGGRASYPSTVVMGVIPARVAGVGTVAVCVPPLAQGEVDPTVLGACRLAKADIVYRMGGAQAVAALAYGTESVSPVDVIVGPGNLYVQEAKHQVSAHVGIDGFAGPSDLLIIAAPDVDPQALALDLLAQAEHGAGTLAVAVSTSGELLQAMAAPVADARDTGAVLRFVEAPDYEYALALAEALAPEHLQLAGRQAEALAPRVTNAGCLFVGEDTGTAFGDYIAGSNHILPTSGAARFASGLSPWHFIRRFNQVRISDPVPLARQAAPVARAEGFELHARSMAYRIRDNR
jgi:histidinol dehydrogenase